MSHKNGSLDIDEPHATTVRIAFEAFLREGSLSRAARWMNDNGYKAKAHLEGGGSRMRLGHFTVDNLQAIIRNKAYIGIKTYTQKGEQKEAKAVWQPLVNEMIFQRANERLTKNHSRLKPLKETSKHPYLLSGVCFCMKCGDHMPGKSATGRNGKVPYYEHSWATKRNSTLTKKTFQCEPTRVQAKKAEALVWGEFCKFIEGQKFLIELQNKVKAIHKNNDEESERGKLKAKLYGVSSQLDALAERLSMLPKTVSATPIFKQMEKLELVKKELEEGLLKIKDLNIDERLVPIETFEEFAAFAGLTIKNNPDFNIRRNLLQKFIHRVEIGVDSIKIYWNLDKDFYESDMCVAVKDFAGQELKIKNPEKNRGFISGLNSSANFGSHSLTIGAPGRN
ncbi:MAG: recombinase family protein [Bdellovibrionaceae bacterium]|nr:recombinase family protein [Pseudobdellovibrionaceae bacterium]